MTQCWQGSCTDEQKWGSMANQKQLKKLMTEIGEALDRANGLNAQEDPWAAVHRIRLNAIVEHLHKAFFHTTAVIREEREGEV